MPSMYNSSRIFSDRLIHRMLRPTNKVDVVRSTFSAAPTFLVGPASRTRFRSSRTINILSLVVIDATVFGALEALRDDHPCILSQYHYDLVPIHPADHRPLSLLDLEKIESLSRALSGKICKNGSTLGTTARTCRTFRERCHCPILVSQNYCVWRQRLSIRGVGSCNE